jgi:hypothetical protein
MKKLILILFISVLTSQLFYAQLKVFANGYVGIQPETSTPLAPLAIGSTGNNTMKVSVQGNTVGINVYRTGSPGYN